MNWPCNCRPPDRDSRSSIPAVIVVRRSANVSTWLTASTFFKNRIFLKNSCGFYRTASVTNRKTLPDGNVFSFWWRPEKQRERSRGKQGHHQRHEKQVMEV